MYQGTQAQFPGLSTWKRLCLPCNYMSNIKTSLMRCAIYTATGPTSPNGNILLGLKGIVFIISNHKKKDQDQSRSLNISNRKKITENNNTFRPPRKFQIQVPQAKKKMQGQRGEIYNWPQQITKADIPYKEISRQPKRILQRLAQIIIRMRGKFYDAITEK